MLCMRVLRCLILLALTSVPTASSMATVIPACGGTLATLTAPSFSCTVGDLLFTDFTLTSIASGPAMPVTPDQVSVVALAARGLLFSSQYFFAGATLSDPLAAQFTEIGYKVASLDPLLGISDASFSWQLLDSVDVSGMEFWSAHENGSGGGAVFSLSGGAIGERGSGDASFSPVEFLSIQTGVFELADACGNPNIFVHPCDFVQMGPLANEFSLSQVPEPTTLTLLLPGLGMMGGLLTHRRPSHSK